MRGLIVSVFTQHIPLDSAPELLYLFPQQNYHMGTLLMVQFWVVAWPGCTARPLAMAREAR